MSSLSSVCGEYRKIPDWHFKLVMFSQVCFDVESGLRANPPVFPSAFVTVCFMFTFPKLVSFYCFDHKPASASISHRFKLHKDPKFLGHST